VLLNAETGLCDCVFLDNGCLMDLRTGLAGAAAAKHLALAEVETVGVIGTGVQARYQIESNALVRSFSRVLVHGRSASKVAEHCADIGQRLGVEVIGVDSPETLVRQSQIVVTTTQATKALISADWVKPGAHITAMGADLPAKQELDPQILKVADLVACDRVDQCLVGGELQHMAGAGIDREVVELGDITSAANPQRARPGISRSAT
jgi:ornithine cyclodeaminase/alanine dehydrogenase-like protein (mu-crystallin family)